MAGSWAQKMQFGRESTNGTAVAADTIWRGPFRGIKDDRQTEKLVEDIGTALQTTRTYTPQLGAMLELAETELTVEQLPHILEMGIKQVESGTADGTTSSGYTYTYALQNTAINDISAYTWETGDDDGAEEMEYTFCESFALNFVKGQSAKMSAQLRGRQVSTASFTGALSAPSVDEISASAGTLYIDDNDGTIGSTAVSAGNIFEASLSVTTGWKARHFIDSGQLYFHDVVFDKEAVAWELTLKWLHDTKAIAEKVFWRSNTSRLFRLEFTGSDYGTAGDAVAFSGKKGVRIDLPGAYMDFDSLDREDGSSIIECTIQGGYDNTAALSPSILVANELANLP